MTREPLGELYFQWLYRQVASLRLKNPARTYWVLLRHLHAKEFVWFVPNDDNRVADGKELRLEFLNEIHEDPRGKTAFLEHPCSVLEMLIALSRRLSFHGGGASSAWFWHMIANLGLRDYTDAHPGSPMHVERVINRLIERKYQPDGTGGLFPLQNPYQDQRQTEIWYQMNSYLNERG